MLSINGYEIKTHDYDVVSVAEGKRLRAKSLKADVWRLRWKDKPYVNPATYTPTEQLFIHFNINSRGIL